MKLNGNDYDSFFYDETLNIDEYGTFDKFMNQGGYKYAGEGVWYFGCKNKEVDIKDKEMVIFAYRNEKNDPGSTYSYLGFQVDNVYLIDQLKNKKMVLKRDYSYYDYDGKKVTCTETFTYEKEE